MAYLNSVGVRKQDPTCTRLHSPVCDCFCKTKPIPCPLKFVHWYVWLGHVERCKSWYFHHMLGLFCSITRGPVPADHNRLSFVLIRSRMAVGDMLWYQYYQVTDWLTTGLDIGAILGVMNIDIVSWLMSLCDNLLVAAITPRMWLLFNRMHTCLYSRKSAVLY